MQDRHYVGVYWGPRKETALECARRSELFFHMLARCDPSYTRWYRAGRGFPRDLPGYPVQTEVGELEKLLLKGRSRTDVGKKIIENLGFNEYMWNAKEGATHLSISCGGYSLWGPPNSCLLAPTRDVTARERLLSYPVMAKVLTSMATAWDPDYGLAGSTEMIRLIHGERSEVSVGWLTYLSCRLGQLPPLPSPVRIEPVGKLGWLLTLSPEPMIVDNPEHVALTARLRELLDRAGILALPEPPGPVSE